MKRKVNINRPEVSADEINQRRNFDSVLKNSAGAAAKPLLKKPWFLSSVVVATIAIVTTVVLLNKTPQTKNDLVVKENSEEQKKVSSSDEPGDAQALNEFYKAEEAKPCIAPPIKELNIPYTVFKVSSEKGGSLNFKTGSKLTIPKNAFVDESGKPLKGEVELRYREFHDPADFFVSGIPMTYDSAGVKYQFESAGMMEMLAYQDGKPVNMAAGKMINIELASEYKGTEYNLYKLDTLKNNWSCLGKDKVEMKPHDEGKAIVKKEKFDDKVEQTSEYKAIEVKKEEAKVVKEKEIAALPKPIAEPKKPVKVSKDRYNFNFEVDLKDFPEFSVYKDVRWEVGAENKSFSQATFNEINKTEWEDAALKEGTKKGENYFLTLKKGSKKINDLVVYPVFEGKGYETAMKDFQEKFSKYNIVLEKRKTEEKKIEDAYTARLEQLKNEQLEAERKWKKEMNSQMASMTTEEKTMRVFKISSFGVYNSDCPNSYPKGVSCVATLENDKHSKLMCYDVYLVDKQKNGLFTYYKNPITTFSFNPKSNNILWTVESGVLYYLLPEQFIDLKNGTQSISMKRVEQKFETVDEMKKFFNL